MFKIKYYYKTGDSFGSHDEEEILEFEWNDIEKAREALKRIKEHYNWYCSLHSYKEDKPVPKWWYKPNHIDEYSARSILFLEMDHGEEVQFWPPWIGYFESLYSAEIVLDEKIEI